MTKRHRPLARKEWDFREVPEPECQLACWYEYARESRRLRNILAVTREDESLTVTDAPLLMLIRIYGVRNFDRPYMSIRGKWNGRFGEGADKTAEPECFFFGKVVMSKTLPIPPHYDGNSGFECFMARIVWRGTSDNQLVNAFWTFLGKHRPAEFPGNEHLGQRTASVWSDRLEWLGMMRLLNYVRPRDLAAECPEAWAKYKHDDITRVEKRLYAGRAKARKEFLQMFPELTAPLEKMGKRKAQPAEEPRSHAAWKK